MKIAIIGSRGFLTEYGGYETFVRKLALGLKDNAFSVIVYGIAGYHNPENDGYYPEITRVWLPTISVRFLEKVVSSLLAVIHVCFSKADAILSISVSPGLLLFLPRLFGKKVIVNPDGIEWQRMKWSSFINFWLRVSELTAVLFSHLVVADSKTIANYIKNKYKKRVIFVPYGADANERDIDDSAILSKYELRARQYFLQVCRLEPENNPDLTISEFLQYDGDKKLVVVGDTPHSIEYKQKLQKMCNHKVRLLGGIYGSDYKVILRNAYCYIHGHEAGGTNPALLEAMASARCPIVLDVPYNREVIEDCGLSFLKAKGDLSSKLEMLDKNQKLVINLGQKAFNRATQHYTWDKVIAEYHKLFRTIICADSHEN